MIENSEKFFTNTIGKIVNIHRNTTTFLYRSELNYGIEYENIPKFIREYYCPWRQDAFGNQYRENIIWVRLDMIKIYAKTKDEVELKLQANKYNV